jgi:hypothetical protein
MAESVIKTDKACVAAPTRPGGGAAPFETQRRQLPEERSVECNAPVHPDHREARAQAELALDQT